MTETQQTQTDETTHSAQQDFIEAVRAEEEPRVKSGVQKRFDKLTREKYDALRQVEDLSGEVAELRADLQKAKNLLQGYRSSLEQYRSRFVEIVAKEKHAR